jgi:hypothetical protein
MGIMYLTSVKSEGLMHCPKCKEQIDLKELSVYFYNLSYLIIFRRLGWIQPENLEPWVFSKMLRNTAGTITQAILDCFDFGSIDWEDPLSEEEIEESELRSKIKELESEIAKFKKRVK